MILALLLACTPSPVVRSSDHGPPQVWIPGGAVTLGRRRYGRVPGWEPPAGPRGTAGPDLGLPPSQRSVSRPPPRPPQASEGGPPPGGRPAGGPPPNTTRGPNSHSNVPPSEAVVSVDGFWIDRTEVTQAQYQEFVRDTGYPPPFVDEPWAADGWNWEGTDPPGPDLPVVLTNWYDARAYCAWADKRLPTEAEWQRAALGALDTERVYPWGNVYDGDAHNHGQAGEISHDSSDGYERLAPVGSYPRGATPEGVLDLFGNAWEWTADIRVNTWQAYTGERKEGRLHNPRSLGPGPYAAVRGGSWYFDLRPEPGAERHAFLTEIRRKTSGFRCASDGSPPPPR